MSGMSVSTSNATVTASSSGLAPAATDLTVINILTYAFLCVVTFGIGAAVKVPDLRDVAKCRKKAFIIGLGCQYLVMPAAARLVATLLNMPGPDALGLILLGCCPGGATSNAFSYFAKADMALSVSMTAVSNGLAFATLPLLLALWTRGISSLQAAIPFLEIMGSLLMVLLPAALGIVLRHYRPNAAKYAERLGAVSGGVLILTSTFVGLITNGRTLGVSELFPWTTAVGVCLVAPVGMLSALGAMVLLRTPCCVQRTGGERTPLPVVATVVMETGIQNTVIALAICTLTSAGWSRDAAFRLQLMPIMWGLVVSTEAVVVMLVFRLLIGREEKQVVAQV